MSTHPGRLVTGLLVSALIGAGFAAPVRAAGIQAPWFERYDLEVSGSVEPLTLAASYLPFWTYAEGIAWAQYCQGRERPLPVVYAARPATPLPTLPAPEANLLALDEKPAPAPEPPPVPAPQPDPKPEPAPEPAPAPEPEPAPAPQPEPEPEPEPEPAPAPAPAPKPEPAPAPKPAPTPAPLPAGLTATEKRMVELVNAERAAAGLAPFQVDMRLVQTARDKSQDMIDYGYFDHNSPRLGSPFDQMKSAGITYRAAGENIAGNQTVDAAHKALMNSPGHRANILSTKFTHIGVGIVEGGRYGLMFTQQFLTP